MKQVFIMAALLFASILTINAQNGERTRTSGTQQTSVDSEAPEKTLTAEEMADKETARQTKRFGLSPDQVAQAKVINLNYSQQRIEVAQQTATYQTREAVQSKLKEIRMAQMEELKTILTPEQQAKLVRTPNNDNMGTDGRMRGQNRTGSPNGN